MSLNLQIWPKNIDEQTDKEPLKLTFYVDPAVEAAYKHGSDEYTLTPVGLSFNKQMYQPGEIDVRIQFNRKLPVSVIETNFQNQKVELSDGTNTLATNYYIHEFSQDTRVEKVLKDNGGVEETYYWYVDFKIHSLDKLLTLKKDNKTYVAKRLGTDILIKKAGGTALPYAENVYLNKANEKQQANDPYEYLLISFQNKLKKETTEFIQPYLVQYNESFYDLLARTANRWGEFVYFEEGKLTLGRKDFSSITGYTTPDLKNYLSVSHIKSAAETISDNCAKAVVTDDYLESVRKSHKPEYDNIRKWNNGLQSSEQSGNEYIQQAGDMYAADDIYSHKVAQSFLNMKGNVIDWAFNTFYDDGIAAAQNEHLLYHREKEYNEHFFSQPTENGATANYNVEGEAVSDVQSLRYGTVLDKINGEEKTTSIDVYWPYADKDSSADNDTALNVKNYRAVLSLEAQAATDSLCVEMGDNANTNYQYLRLGELFKYDGTCYVVTKVEGMVEDPSEPHFCYRLYAIPALSSSSDTTNIYYPPMLPTGHIRLSGPQRGFVHDTLDPTMNGRYRVRLWWQLYDENTKQLDEPPTPWLRVSREMTNNGCGGVWQLEEGTEVLLDFLDGNVELPYIVGTLQQTAKRSNARSTMFNNLDLTTPAGHAIRMTDGEGGGIANFFASFQPIWKMVQGFDPQEENGLCKDYGKYSKYFDGGIELTDRYGIYSIKASTDQRNISVKSPWGDVLLSAFTGITISAPNGDVKIQGKNVSIEARNNVSITSGTNIANGLFGNTALGAGALGGGDAEAYLSGVSAAIKMVAGKVLSYLDMPVMRHFFELILRPVCGAMDIKSYRAISLKAGFNSTNNAQNENIFDKNEFIPKLDAWLKSNNNVVNAGMGLAYRFKDDDWLGKAGNRFNEVKVNDTDILTGLVPHARQAAQDAQQAAQDAQQAVHDAQQAVHDAQQAVQDAQQAVDDAQQAVDDAQGIYDAAGDEDSILNIIDGRIRTKVKATALSQEDEDE